MCRARITRATLDRLCETEASPFHRAPGNGHRRFLSADLADFADERERLRLGHAEIVEALAAVGLADN